MRRLLPGWVQWPQLDYPLLAALLLLMGFGLVVLYSASGQDMAVVNRQALRLGFGLVLMLVISQVPPRVLRAWTPWLYGLGVAMLLATLVLGVGRSTQRWLDFFEEMASAYLDEIRSVQPKGPYLIGGFSGGGITAFEMAHQLREANGSVCEPLNYTTAN